VTAANDAAGGITFVVRLAGGVGLKATSEVIESVQTARG
jgi:hypothetical protein